MISCVLRLPTASVASTLTVTTLRLGSGWLNLRFGDVVASVKCSLLLMKTLTVASSVSSVTVIGRDRCRHECAEPKTICGGGVAPSRPISLAAGVDVPAADGDLPAADGVAAVAGG